MTLKFEDLPESAQKSLMAGKPVSSPSPEFLAELDALKAEAAERKAEPKVAKPVYAIERDAPLSKQVKVTRALKVLHGEGVHWVEHGPRLIYFTPGELCTCRACDSFMRKVADLGYIEFPSIMIVCWRCGSKHCPQSHNHEDPCNLEIKEKHEDWLFGVTE